MNLLVASVPQGGVCQVRAVLAKICGSLWKKRSSEDGVRLGHDVFRRVLHHEYVTNM